MRSLPWSDSEQYALVGRNLVRTSGSAKPIHRGPRTLIDTPFAVSSIAADEILLVTLRFRAGAERYAIKAFMFQIADAFAEVERLSEKNMKDLFWEQKPLPNGTLRCPSTQVFGSRLLRKSMPSFESELVT